MMKFRLFLESQEERRRVLAPIGSEHMEHLVKTEPVIADFGSFKETWYLSYTQWQSSVLEREGGGGRILISSSPDNNHFDGGIIWVQHNNMPVIGLYYVDPLSRKMIDPKLADAAKRLKITHAFEDVDSVFTRTYSFTTIPVED